MDASKKTLQASDILQMEFEYARTTASEAMRDRHTMVNFYLLTVGIVASGVLVILEKDLPNILGTLLLWVLCIVGWLYLLKVVRLRQAWYDSVQAMNLVKDFYISYSKDFSVEELSKAFKWKSRTLPLPGKRWTVFYYSACLIAILNSVAFSSGGLLIVTSHPEGNPYLMGGILFVLGLQFFGFHLKMYTDLLKLESPESNDAATQ